MARDPIRPAMPDAILDERERAAGNTTTHRDGLTADPGTTWQPTLDLRWVLRRAPEPRCPGTRRTWRELQQRWVEVATGTSAWRPIPLEIEEESR